jgi:uncharacterized membrane protein YfcA
MANGFTFLDTPISIDGPLLLVWVAVFLAGIFRGFAGFGSALIIVPALAYIYGPLQAIVIEVLIEIPVSLALVLGSYKRAERAAVLPMLLMFLIFVPLGAYLARSIDPTPMRIAISALVLIMLVVIAQQKRLAAFITPTGTYLAGAFAGLTQGMAAIAGPVFATAILARGAPADQTRANNVCLAGGLIFLSAASFWAVGIMTRATVAYAILAMPALILGVWVGARLFERLSNWNLRPFMLGFVVITALATLIQAIT